MSDARHECPCGKPIHDGAHICADCTGHMRHDLHTMADRWAELEAALTSPTGAPLHLTRHPGSDDNTGNATGIDINEQVSAARTTVANLAWFVVQVIRDDYDDLGRSITMPADVSVPSLLRWIERWHLTHLLTDGAEETAHELRQDVRKAEQQSHRALNSVRTVYVGLPCVEHGTSDMGERIACPGQMTARAVPGIMPDLVCTADDTHRIEPQRWQRDGWRGRFAQGLRPDGVARLARRLAQ